MVLRARQQRSVSTSRRFSTNPKSPVEHGVRHVDKRDTSRTQREQGTALVSHTPVCPSDPLCSPIPTAADAIRVLSLLRLFGFGQRFQTSSLWFHSDGNAETLVEAVGEAVGMSAGMSAGDSNSALNFKCHCTKSGDTGWGVNWPSH